MDYFENLYRGYRMPHTDAAWGYQVIEFRIVLITKNIWMLHIFLLRLFIDVPAPM